MLCTGHDTKFLSYSDLCSLFQIKQTLLAPWRKHNWYESSNEIVQLKEHLKKLSHVGLWSRMGQSRQQILSDWTNTPALPLLASLSLSRHAMIIPYHVFICLIHPFPHNTWRPHARAACLAARPPHPPPPPTFPYPLPMPSPPSPSPATMAGCCFQSLSASFRGKRPPPPHFIFTSLPLACGHH